MRTKTTLLCAAALAAGVVSSMAQSNVYSLNIVGYVNVVIPPNNSLLSNPLNVDNTNSASTVLTSIAPLNSGGPPGTLDFFFLLTYNSGIQRFSSVWYEDDFAPGNGVNATNGWATDSSGNTPANPPLLPPGVGFIIDNSGAALTNTFVGSVEPLVNATNSINVPPNNSYISSLLPVSGPISSAAFQFPLAPLNSGGPAGTLDFFFLLTYNSAIQRYSSVWYEDDFAPGNGVNATNGWATDSSGNTPANPPSIALGEGFVIDNSGSTVTWSQTYPVP